jgi:hypothetical protein
MENRNLGRGTVGVPVVDDGLPDLDTWHQEFGRIVNGTYVLRGVEVTLRGDVALRDGHLLLERGTPRPPIRVLPLTQEEKIQWNHTTRSPKLWRTTKPRPSSDSSSRPGIRPWIAR